MDELLQYIIKTTDHRDQGDLSAYTDPSAPTDLGSPLTQDEIDTLKKFVKELNSRFTEL